MWNTTYNDEAIQFDCKADAFKWLNEAKIGIGTLYLYCGESIMYIKNVFGIFDQFTQSYVKGNLPVEYYN
jgi:hypothetical protein